MGHIHHLSSRRREGSDDESGSGSEEEDEEEEESSEEDDDDGLGGGKSTQEPELTRAERKALKKQQGNKEKAKQKKKDGGDEDDEESEDDSDLVNPNREMKRLNISDLSSPRQLSRKERSGVLPLYPHSCLTFPREAKEKQEAKDRYWKVRSTISSTSLSDSACTASRCRQNRRGQS